MDINIRTINHPHPEKFRTFAEEELNDAFSESELITSCHLHIRKEEVSPPEYHVVIEVHPKRRQPIAARSKHEIAHTAVIGCIKKVQKQLKRIKEKR